MTTPAAHIRDDVPDPGRTNRDGQPSQGKRRNAAGPSPPHRARTPSGAGGPRA